MSAAPPAIAVRGVAKRYGGTVALAGVDLEVGEGTVLALLGPNGAGKTTLVRTLATLARPDAGAATVLGHDVAGDPEAVRRVIGLTGQFAAVDEILTGRENLEMFGRLFGLARDSARDRARELLARFELEDAADRPAKTYSGGMRRRLDLASSLVERPRVLFLDEPTTGLDPRSRNTIWQVVRDLVADGTTVLLTTQYLEEADQLADRIVVIDHGRVIAAGTGDELKARVGGEMLDVQLASGADRDRAAAALATVGCGEPQPGARPERLSLSAAHAAPLDLLHDASGALRAAQVRVTDMALRRPTLDDVFLELTGRPAGEDGAAAPITPAPPAPAPTLRERRRAVSGARLRRELSDALVVTQRNLRHFRRQPQLLLFSTVQPIMFVLLFAFVFGGAIDDVLPQGLDYIEFLLPGILVQSVAFRATQTAVGLGEDLQRGVVDRFRSMPMSRAAVLVGRTLADLVRNMFILVLMAGVGYAVGFEFRGTALEALGAIAVVAGFAFALSWIFVYVALRVQGAEAAQSAGFIAIFPLVFASSIFVPTDSMPSWLAAFASVSPVSLSADAARSLALGGIVPGHFGGYALWVVVLLAIFVPLSVRRYRRMT